MPSVVKCYMHQPGFSKKEACDEFNKQVEDAWKDINQGFFDAQKKPSYTSSYEHPEFNSSDGPIIQGR